MGFDVENFGLGLLVGWGTAYGLYRARHAIQAARDSVNKGAGAVQKGGASGRCGSPSRDEGSYVRPVYVASE